MGGAGSTQGRNNKRTKKFCRKMKGRDHSIDLSVDGRITLEW